MSFWAHHGWLFLLGCAFFPRITTAFFATMTFGFWSILGWIFTPHLLVAILATKLYWTTDPLLVVIAWFFALSGSSAEAATASKATTRVRR